ncbi:Peroxisomal membrane signal receptor PTS1 [Malassezia sp. CBS 17886]|nr:Peroxisomal membrane signal receptor PTS1 [Malassezia sp. CBS 17886]
MAFQSMLSGAECSTGNNSLSQFLKHTQTDRSLQQDGAQQPVHPGMGPGAAAFRSRPSRPGGGAEMDAFLHREAGANGGGFDMHAMRAEMEAVRSGARAPAARGGSGAAWAQEMRMQPPHAGDAMGAHAPGAQGVRPAWGEQFHAQDVPAAAPAQAAAAREAQWRGGGGGSGMSSMYMGGGLGGMGSALGGMGGPMGMHSYMGGGMRGAEQLPQQAPDQRFVELDNAQWEAQFEKLEAEDAEHTGDVRASDAPAKGKGRADARTAEERELNELREMEDRLRDRTQDPDPRFEELWNALKDKSVLRKSEELAEWEKKLVEAIRDEDPVNSTHPGGGLGPGVMGLNEEDGLGDREASLRHTLNEVDERGFPVLGEYQYTQHNPFATHPSPFAEGMRLLDGNGSLTDAALLFEVATQRDAVATGDELQHTAAERSRAWQRLGESHAMNEHERQAVQALEEALRIDASNLEAHMSLAVSYINEGYDAAAHQTLLRYIARTHPHLAPSADFPKLRDETTNPWARLNYVRELFLKAARENAAQGQMDPEIQIGLGVLFYSSSSFEQARDCFKAALESRPDDWQLWNRLGATLANGGNPELAIDAYQKALELRPTFTRAIYNLSVSCLNLGAHREAAEHLLSALTLQRAQSLPESPDAPRTAPMPPLSAVQESEGLWGTLRSISVILMNELDLANECHVGANLDVFRRGGFDF